jgi:hypothetical protein
MRRLALLAATVAALLALASPAGAVVITNGTVSLGVNQPGDLNDPSANIGITYNPTGNDGTRGGCYCEGWGAGYQGADGPVQARADVDLGTDGFAQQSFANSADSAVSTVDVLQGDTHTLRLTQDFHPSPTTQNLYEITTTLTNLTSQPLSDVRYEREMDWDIEPTAFNEYVTINRGATPPASLIYSDDDGFTDNYPFTQDSSGATDTAGTMNQNVVDNGPADHGARFTFSFGTLAPGESKQFFLYYGAAGTEEEANAVVSAAALEVFSYGQPSTPDGDDPDTLPDGRDQGKPNTFIWGFRAVGGRPIIAPTLSLAPRSGSGQTGSGTGVTATLDDVDGNPVPNAEIVFAVAGANPGGAKRATDDNGQASFGYTGANAGNDTITACLDSNANGRCDAGEVADSVGRSWSAPAPPPSNGGVQGQTTQSPEPVLGQSVVAGAVSGTVKVKGKNGKFHTLGADEALPLGTTIDATKGRVKVTSASGPGGATQSADFYQGAFVITQTGGSKPITQLALVGALSCSKKSKASAAAKKKKVRRLWGDGHGSFRTKGKRAAATVRGTKWLTEDRCDSTKVTVKRGIVLVRDFVKRKNFLIRKGHSYVARAKKKKK